VGKRYIPELDGLRAIAVTAVILFHASLSHSFGGGFVGVDLFFVLSAYLITGIICDGQSLPLFFWRRFLRLMPALCLLLATYVALGPMLWPGYAHNRDAAITALYLSDYSYTFWRVPFFLQHTWSLAVEEHFYLLWPFIVPLLSRARRPGAWLVVTYLIFTLWRLPFADDWQSYYYRFDTHATGLIAGAWLYFVRPRITGLQATFAGTVLILIFQLGRIEQAWLFITPAEIASVMLIGYAERSAVPLLRSASLVAVGRISYGMYLWHYPIAVAVRDDFGFWRTALFTFGASLSLAALSHGTIEAAARKLRSGIPRLRYLPR
jgi:peptidoglycan/LPS O-acetylase OafA/YrhL